MLDAVVILIALAFVMLVVSLLEPFWQRVALPGTLLLALVGLLLGVVVYFSGYLPTDGPLRHVASGLMEIGGAANAYLYLFLPPLLFSGGLSVDLRLMRDEIAAVLLMAVVAVVACTAAVGLTLDLFTDVGIVACLLVGAVVASTDPSAVLGVFRDIGAPRRLSTLVSGEALLNDAAAIVLFTLFVELIMKVGTEVDMATGSVRFVAAFFGGLAIGLVMGKGAGLAFAYLRNWPTAATTVSVAVAYLSFIIAEVYLQSSGAVAVVTAGLVAGVEAPTRLSEVASATLEKAWAQLEYWANSLIFVLASMLAVHLLGEATWWDLVLLVALIVAELVSRAVVLYMLLPALVAARMTQRVNGRYKAVILWGGLRGALTLVLALSLAGDQTMPPEVRHLVAVLATSFVFFTLFVQAPTLKPLLKLLGLDRLPLQEQMLRDRVTALSHDEVERQVREVSTAYGFPDGLVAQALPGYPGGSIQPAAAVPPEVGLRALAQHERELYLRFLREQMVSHRLTASLVASADRLIDAVKEGGFAGYRRATQRTLRYTALQRGALWLQRRFGWQRPLAQALADRFEALLVTEVAVRELQAYAQGPLAEVMGRDVAAELQAALVTRGQQVASALLAIETRYPAYAEALRVRYLMRAALRVEGRGYEQRLAQSLISREVYADLQRDLDRRWEVANRRPPLDLGLELAAMVRRVPLFADLPPQRLLSLIEQLRPSLGVPGQRLITKGTRGTRMYFIVTGRVHVQLSAGDVELEGGDFFGEMALLSRAPRNADVTALDLCHFLVLEARDFRRVLREDAELKAKIEAVAAARKAA